MSYTTDVAVIGGGIVGLATAYQVLRDDSDTEVLVLEKESALAQHQTGRNSGVLHTGVYYEPGSLKAKNCRAGKAAMEAFCDEEGIPYERCGKVIVATEQEEMPVLQRIYERGQANGVQCEMVGPDRLREIEPHVRGVQAIHVPEAGIVDYQIVAERLAERIREMGGRILTDAKVEQIHSSNGITTLETAAGEVTTRFVVNCAGLQSDRVAEMSGEAPDVQIVPFRGEYYRLSSDARHLCQGLVYPVPDPSFPFLGVHFTRRINGEVECGPNAVLAFAREGYEKTTVDFHDLAEILSYPGFLRLAATYWRTGLGEMWRSYRKEAFVRALQKLIPEVRAEDLEAAPSGVRAQAVRPDGELHDDFIIDTSGTVVNVCNAPSPAATSALTIGQTIADRLSALETAGSSAESATTAVPAGTQ
jgi:L-2-hydroxyglutarate oxidase LhgO